MGEQTRAVVMYQGEKGEVVFDVDKGEETIWASVDQIAHLFGVDRSVITKHLANIYRDEELEQERSIKKNLIVRMEGTRRVRRAVNFYNLDAIISVGYRVNSKKATKFRVWATSVLRKYMIGGVAVNERRIKELSEKKLEEVEGTLSMVRRLISKTELEEGEAKGVLEVISKYGRTVETIKEFGERRVSGEFDEERTEGRKKTRRKVTIGEVRNLVDNLREEEEENAEFGEIRDEKRLEMELEKDGEVARRASELLYYIVKTRPFKDGNRRIGALVFIYFLTVNNVHLSEEGETKISDRALTAIVLLIAESKEAERELMVGLVEHLLL